MGGARPIVSIYIHVCVCEGGLRFGREEWEGSRPIVSIHIHVCTRVCEGGLIRAGGMGGLDQLYLYIYTCVCVRGGLDLGGRNGRARPIVSIQGSTNCMFAYACMYTCV